MRRPLVAVGLVIGLTLGPSSLGGALAAKPSVAPVGTGAGSSVAHGVAGSVSGGAIVQYAMRYLGYPYTAVGNSPSTGFSCIGFVSYVYQSLGINLPGDLGGAMGFAPQVAFNALLPGDVLYFQNTVWSGLSHAAIYIGGGRFVHAEWYNRGVVISSFSNDPVDGDYWTAHYLGANRPWAMASSPPAAPSTQPSYFSRTYSIRRPVSAFRHHVSGPSASVRVSALNVRAGASLSSGIRTVVGQGTRLILLGHWQGWYKVGLPGGGMGWVIAAGIGRGAVPHAARRYALQRTRTGGGSGFSIGNPRSPRRVAAPAPITIQGTVAVRASGLRVHTSPSIGAPVIDIANQGQRLASMSHSAGWVKVQMPDGRIGWISDQYVQANSPWYASKRAAAVSGGTPRGATAKVALNIRASPSLSAGILTVLAPGTSYQQVRWSNGWARVRLSDGTTGWISGTVMGGAPRATSSGAGRSASQRSSAGAGSVVTAGVRLHLGPGLHSATLRLVAAGTHVQVLGSVSGWTRVRLPSRQTGYVLGTYVGS